MTRGAYNVTIYTKIFVFVSSIVHATFSGTLTKPSRIYLFFLSSPPQVGKLRAHNKAVRKQNKILTHYNVVAKTKQDALQVDKNGDLLSLVPVLGVPLAIGFTYFSVKHPPKVVER